MLGHIRKRVQVRRQCSVESYKNNAISPCTSPLSTPNSEMPPLFPTFYQEENIQDDDVQEDEEQMEVEELYKTPTQKAVPTPEFSPSDANTEHYKSTFKMINDLKIKRNTKKQRLRKTRSGSGSKIEKDSNHHLNNNRKEYFLRSTSTDKPPDSK